MNNNLPKEQYQNLTSEEFEYLYKEEERDRRIRRMASEYDFEHWAKTGELMRTKYIRERKEYYWVKKDDLAILKYYYREEVPYTRDSLLFSLNNVRKNRNSYFTQEAYDEEVAKFEEGLSLFSQTSFAGNL